MIVMAEHFDEPQGEARKSAESASKPRLDLLPPPAADRFRLRDVWRSPRGKDWQVDKVEGGTGGIARLRALHNRHSTQWRGIWETGKDMTNAWERLESAADPVTYS